jgi:hypothetical protein
VAATRGLTPYILVGILTGAAVVGAGLGAASAPTSEEVALRSAAVLTTQASSLRFTAVVPAGSAKALGRTVHLAAEEVIGLWEAPNRWQTTIGGGSNQGRTVTSIGSYLYIKNPGQTAGRLDALLYGTPPFDVPYGFFGLPPLSSITTATDVARHGDRYTFVIPDLDVPPQWIAYAPLSGARYVPPVSVARNVDAIADVVGGYIVNYDFPDGVVLGRRHLRPASWTLSGFGTAPPVLVPRTER